MRTILIRNPWLIFFLVSTCANAGLIGPDAVAPQIPGFPQHGVLLDSGRTGMGNVAAATTSSTVSPADSITQPAALTLLEMDKHHWSASLNSVIGLPGSLALQPGVIAVARRSGDFAWGLSFAGQHIDQRSPDFYYRDEHGGTGSGASNYVFSDVQAIGSRHNLTAAAAYRPARFLSLGIGTNFLFGNLEKSASLAQYNSDSFSSLLGQYSITEQRKYQALAINLSLMFQIGKNLIIGTRFMTPVSDSARIKASITDNTNTEIYVDPDFYQIEHHVIGADAEAGLGVGYQWNPLHSTLLSFEYHDNVYFGSNSSWENYQFRFGHQASINGRPWRLGGHYAFPFFDQGNKAIIFDSNGDANSWGISIGTRIKQLGDRNVDTALALRQISFDTERYQQIIFSLGLSH